MKTGRGLYRQQTGGVYYVRRRVPADLLDRYGCKFLQKTTGTADYATACRKGDAEFEAWGRGFAEARALGVGPHATLAELTTAVENWRRRECADAAALASGTTVTGTTVPRAVWSALRGKGGGSPVAIDMSVIGAPRAPTVADDVVGWARAYFKANPRASRDRATPHETAILLGRLQPAVRDPEAWREVDGFDSTLIVAAQAGGLTSAVPGSVIALARGPFAAAWLEVVQHREAARTRAVAFLEAFDAQHRAPAAVRVAPAEGGYVPREGDKTVGEVIDQYQAERNNPDTLKQYGHIFRALKELVGADTPIRAVTRDDVLEVRRLLAQIPKNATKLYGKDVALIDAVERGAADDKPRLAPNTLRGYLVNLSAVMNFARLQLRAIDTNPVNGLIPKRDNQIERRGFTKGELDLVFAGLAAQREVDSAHYWVPAVLTFSGCRANEICQLRTEEIAVTEDGIHYLDLTLFAKDGRRIQGKRLKNQASARAVPIHSELIKAGFLNFVARRRAAGDERLFPELTPNTFGTYSHEVSRRFGNLLDRVGLPEPTLVLHGLRHSFRDSCRRAHLPTEIADGLGGWAVKGVGAGYGSRAGAKDDEVKENAANMAKLTMGGFVLPI